jgi:hypothetical protein
MKKVKKVLLGLALLSAVTSISLYVVSFVENDNSKAPISEVSIKQDTPQIKHLKDKMNNSIFNYDTLEANYIEQQDNQVKNYTLAVDYINNRAIGTVSDNNDNLIEEFLVKDRKQLDYSHTSNTYTQANVLDKQRSRSTQRSLTQGGVKHIDLASNPLALPLGGASIAINPEQYTYGLMDNANVTPKEETTYLGRKVTIVDVTYPQEKSDHDKIEFYIDKETGVLLKQTQFKGNDITYELKATNFKINHIIDSNVFDVEIPNTAKLVEDV